VKSPADSYTALVLFALVPVGRRMIDRNKRPMAEFRRPGYCGVESLGFPDVEKHCFISAEGYAISGLRILTGQDEDMLKEAARDLQLAHVILPNQPDCVHPTLYLPI